MGGCLSHDDQTAVRRNGEIEQTLQADAAQMRREVKLLLLGSGESGKSTIVKQMKIIHQDGFSRDELLAYRPTVFSNIAESMRALIEAFRALGIEFDLEINNQRAARFLELCDLQKVDTDASRLLPEAASIVESIWRDPVTPRGLARSSEFYIMDSAPYFFSEIRRIAQADYVPNEQDILYARIKTTGITETKFTMGQQLKIHMVDVGGQRSERKKWIYLFDGVTSIIFCVALSEYDQVLLEDNTQNRMIESLMLFESIVNLKWFQRTSIILFLNKVDLLQEKIARVPLDRYFPEYTGGPDLSKAIRFILSRFTALNRAKLKLFPQLTCATDTSNIRLVFVAVKDTILQNALKDSGIM
ncbi:heterotrimeric G protein alpha subunit [Blastocladiella britannica]|nr:heterotrimeric G protein alpha subunit [Blastocladiella britannica]